MTSSPRSPSRLVGCHGLLYNLALIVPSVIFVAYLAFLARRSFAKLTNGYSYVMIAYYALIWLISVLNLLWCLVQVNMRKGRLDYIWTAEAAESDSQQ
ncbi:hypothetical protein BHM03_00018021 [Ensete ventricosum]|nr:hypothetical protein BHM03_00018021 [Ensete ventricosum]